MREPHRQYTKELHDAFRYWATWLPGTPLTLGVVGTIDDLVFVPRATLESYGITFETVRDESPANYEYATSGSVSIEFKGKGETSTAFKYVGDADAGVAVSFSRENSVVFSGNECYEHRIKDIADVGKRILEVRRSGGIDVWPDNYAAITELVSAKSGSILISGSRESVVEVKANADIGSLVDLGRAELGLAIKHSKNMVTQIVAASGLTPLFRAIRINQDFWGRTSAEAAVAPGEEPEFETINYDDEFASLQ